MRWSLSTYPRRICEHPQFGKCQPDPRREYDIGVLQHTANSRVGNWREKVRVAVDLARAQEGAGQLHRKARCSKVHFVYYESFLQNTTEVTSRMARAIHHAGAWTHAPSTSAQVPVTLRPTRIHGSNINGFVANPHEVVEHFVEHPYPTFGQVLQEAGYPQLCPRRPKASFAPVH